MRPALALAWLPLACLALAACKKEKPPPSAKPALPSTPTAVASETGLHAVQCGAVTAEWLGAAPQPPGAPKSSGATALRFRFPGGKVQPFEPAGALAPADWSFDVFSPDCARVALLQDHEGPFHVVKLDGLEAYLAGAGPEAIVQKKGEAEPMAHGELRWLSPTRLELTASCCGGVEVFQVDVATPDKLERTHFFAQAPKGAARAADGGWEVRP